MVDRVTAQHLIEIEQKLSDLKRRQGITTFKPLFLDLPATFQGSASRLGDNASIIRQSAIIPLP